MDISKIYDDVVGITKEEEKRLNLFDLDNITNNANSNQVAEIVKQDLGKQWSVSDKEAKRYERFGVNYNPIDAARGLLDVQLAENQSGFSKIKNALIQTVADEIVLGTVKVVFDLFDMVGNAITTGDNDYSNPITRALENAQQAVRDWAPIHTTPGVSIDNGGLTDIGWWASNIPSVASSLTLLLPSTGIVKGVSYAGKLIAGGGKAAQGARKISSFSRKATRTLTGASRRLKQGRELNQFQLWANKASTRTKFGILAESAMTASLSRAMENYQESRQIYDDSYEQNQEILNGMSDEEYNDYIQRHQDLFKNVDTQDRNAVAKHIASKAADKTFAIDWTNVVFDVIQLYALRNAWKGFTTGAKPNGAMRQMNRQAAVNFGKKVEEVTEQAIKFAGIKKAGRWIGNKLYDSNKVVLAELSEGAEEAINYIAQQEGMHYGNVLLEQEPASIFDTRLQDYIASPELHDAAFWGVLGGVVFQGLGSKFRQVETTIKLKNEDKNNEANKEAAKDTPFYKLDDTIEIQRIKSDIENRSIKSREFFDNLDKIKRGIDIYSSTEGNEVTFNNEVEQEAAIDKLFDEYLTELTVRSMNVGTIDMLKSFFSDENVRKGFIEQGMTTEEDSKQFIDKVLGKIEKIENTYDNELIALDNASAKIKGYVPMEYLQILAYKNVSLNRRKEVLDNEDVKVRSRINTLKKQFSKELEELEGVDLDRNAKIDTLTHQLGKLRATRKLVLSNDPNREKLSTNISLRTIDKQINEIERQLSNEELVYATFQSLRYVTQDGNIFIQQNNNEAFAYIDKIITNRLGQVVGNAQTIPGLEYISDRSRTALSDDAVERFRKLEKELTAQNNKLKAISPELSRLTDVSANLKLAGAIYESQIVRKPADVEEKIMELHNSMDEARTEAVNIAKKIINELYGKYGDEIKNIITNVYRGTKLEDVSTDLSLNERNKLFEALKVLDLTKTYNRGLIDGINKSFAIIDAVKAAEEKNSSISPDSISATENENQIITSDDNENLADGSKTWQNLENEDKNDSENEGQKPTQTHKPYILIPTEDGTGDTYNFTITEEDKNTEEGVKYLNDYNFYYKEEDANILDPFEITKEPIVKVDENGNITVVSKGIISKKDDNTTAQAATIKKSKDKEKDEEPTILPTGGLKQTNTNNSDDFIIGNDNYTNDIYDDTFKALANAIKSDINVDLDVITEKLIQEYIRKGADPEVAQRNANLAKDDIASMRAEVLDDMQSSVIELITNRESFDSSEYANIAKKVIDNYAKSIGLEKIDGKYYFSLEDVLRYINESFKNNRIGDNIYWSFKEYLLSKNNTDFILTDAGEVNDKNFLDNVHKSAEERYKERLGNVKEHQVDIMSYLRYIQNDSNKEELTKQFNEALMHLGIGTVLTPEVVNGRIYFKDNKGRVAATIPIPTEEKVDEKNGRFTIINEGWKTDVLVINSNVDSRLKDFFESILLSNSDAAKELNKILYKHAFSKNNVSNDLDKDLEFFKSNEIIRNAIKQGFTTEEKLDDAFTHLLKLWRFVNTNKVSPNKVDNIRIKASLNMWFNKINNSYLFAKQLEANPNSGRIIVSDIKGREVIRVADKVDVNGTGLPHVQKAIGKNVKSGTVRIAAADIKTAGQLKVSGLGSISASAIGAANTFVMIEDEAGKLYSVHAYPIIMSDEEKGDDVKEILNEIYNEGNRLITSFQKNPNQENYDAIKKFFIRCFSSSKGNSSPFYNIYVSDKGNECTIGYSNKNDSTNQNTFIYVAFRNNKAIINANNPGSENATFRNTFEKMLKLLKTNIKFSYIESDSHGNYSLQGIAKKENGKFIIEVGKVRKEYNSFNEFIIKNNLVKLNTTPNELGTNFVLVNSDNANTVRVSVMFENTTSPIEEIKDVKTPTSTSENTREQVINILNDESIEHKGNAILDAAILSMTESAKNALKNISGLSLTTKELFNLNNLSLLPKKIIFDAEFNNRSGYSEINAEYSPSTNTVTIGERWMQLWSNPQTRDIAIKKLIHEELHSKLVRNKGYVRNAKGIFDEFKAFINSGQDNERYKAWREQFGVSKEKADEYFRQYLFDDKPELEGLEEFLVESLTNSDVASILNAIDAKEYKTSKSKNLFQAILELLSKIFNWNIREGSLYEKELNTLKKVFKQPSIKEDTSEKLSLFEDTQVNIDNTNNNNTQTENNEEETNEEINEAASIRAKLRENPNRKRRGVFSDRTETSIQPYSEEMKDIKSKAITNGTFMKAPNGKPTNLTERQWLQVRTKAFKEWFGDWINDPTNASKVVDENGEPLVVYHGNKDSNITEFVPNKGKYSNKPLYYFSDSKDTALSYATEGASQIDPNDYTIVGFNVDPNTEEAKYADFKSLEDFDIATRSKGRIYEVFLNIRNPINDVSPAYIHDDTLLKGKNNDGMISIPFSDRINGVEDRMSEDIQYVVLSSNQVKSATDNIGTFSNEDNNIYHSDRIELTAKLTVEEFIKYIPFEDRQNVRSLIENGNINVSCK